MIISFLGVVLVSFSHQTSDNRDNNNNDNENNINNIAGISQCILSALMYAGYELGIKYYGNKLFEEETMIEDGILLQFMIGVTACLCYWPFIVLFDVTEVEIFILPNDMNQWLSVLVPLILDLILQSTLFIGITLLNAEILAFVFS